MDAASPSLARRSVMRSQESAWTGKGGKMFCIAEARKICCSRIAQGPVMSANAPPENVPTIDDDSMAIRAPMRMLGAYPVLSLRFPSIPTPEQFKEQQKQTGESGVAL